MRNHDHLSSLLDVVSRESCCSPRGLLEQLTRPESRQTTRPGGVSRPTETSRRPRYARPGCCAARDLSSRRKAPRPQAGRPTLPRSDAAATGSQPDGSHAASFDAPRLRKASPAHLAWLPDASPRLHLLACHAWNKQPQIRPGRRGESPRGPLPKHFPSGTAPISQSRPSAVRTTPLRALWTPT